MGAWLREAFEELLFVEGRLPRTLGRMVWPPGELTAEWRHGRRAAYVHPLRTYLLGAALFFLAWTLAPGNRVLVGFAVQDAMRARGALPTYAESQYRPLQPLPPGQVQDSVARARWQGEFVARRAALRSANADIDARIGAGVQRVTDLLPVLVGVLLVPVLAGLTWAMTRASTVGVGDRRGAIRSTYMEHVVLSTHAHAFGYFLLAAVVLLGAATSPDVALMLWLAGLGLTTVYVLAAMRRNFATGPLLLVAGAILVPTVYLVALYWTSVLAISALVAAGVIA